MLAFLAIGLPTGGVEAPSAPAVRVVATTSIVGDVVGRVGGEGIDLEVLLPLNADPHTFELTPQDLRRLADADVVFVNGLGLETFLDDVLASLGEEIRLVTVSTGVETRQLGDDHDEHGDVDPHVWMDPTNVQVWVDNVAQTLGEIDPERSAAYAANAERYRAELDELHGWISDRVAEVPPADRKLVADHDVWGYFADRYGFEFLGAVVPSLSTGAEPSARAIARLIEVIREHGVSAVFIGTTVSSRVAEQVAAETGVELVSVYTGSLSGPDGPAATYLDYMRYNVDAIVGALR